MNKIEIKDLYLVFGPEKQKAFRMLKERKSKNEILKATNCTASDVYKRQEQTLLPHLIRNCWKCAAGK